MTEEDGQLLTNPAESQSVARSDTLETNTMLCLMCTAEEVGDEVAETTVRLKKRAEVTWRLNGDRVPGSSPRVAL